jgi:hypothetical protein
MDGLNYGQRHRNQSQPVVSADYENQQLPNSSPFVIGHFGRTDRIIIGNLPAFPDNINNGLSDRFWIGLVAPRNALLDARSDWPFAR